MGIKKNEMKFTILFNPANPDHVFAANKLNSQSGHNKANYLAQAITYFETNNGLSINAIETVIIDILKKHNPLVLMSSVGNETTDGMTETLKQSINSSLQIFKHG